jgi:hypothetical protein
MTMPGSVRTAVVESPPTGAVVARPKSRIFSSSPSVMKTFSGLRSRWMTPFACAAASDLRAPQQRLAHVQPVLEALAQRLSFEQLHDQVRHRRAGLRQLADVVQRAEVRVAERRQRARLALEPEAHLRIGPAMLGQDFDGHLAVQARVGGAEDVTHPAGADLGFHAVRPQSRTRLERHVSAARPTTSTGSAWPRAGARSNATCR